MLSISSISRALMYAVALCGAAPLFPWLETAPRITLAAGVFAGLWQELRGVRLFRERMLNIAVVPVFVWYAFRFSTASPLEPVTSVLAIMLAIRLAGEKNSRHGLQIHAISLFCLAASSLFDLSPVFLVYLTLMVVLVALSLVLLTFQEHASGLAVSGSGLRRIVVAGLILPLASLPLVVIFFPLLPRTQFPLWNAIGTPAAKTTGFSNKVDPGAAASIAASQAVALRVESPRLEPARLYWRGTVFNHIRGQRWERVTPGEYEMPIPGRERIVQTIYPETGLSGRIIALDAPVTVSGIRTRTAGDSTIEPADGGVRRYSYRAESSPDGVIRLAHDPVASRYLQLPKYLAPRIAALAAEIRHKGGELHARRLELLVQHYRTGGYRYSMSGLPVGESALEEFLFDKRQGHCEFFASSFAILLRSAGVPARLVGGYVGGDYNELGGYYLVTERMAHVWVEAYLAGTGWVRVDPSSFAENAAEAIGAGGRKLSAPMRVRMLVDSLDHAWNRIVITYDFERQLDAARGISERLEGGGLKRYLRRLLPAVWIVICLAAVVYFWRRGMIQTFSRDQRLLRQFCRVVRRDTGIAPDLSRRGIFGLADAAGDERVRRFADIYAGAVYRDRPLSDEEYALLKTICRNGFRSQ